MLAYLVRRLLLMVIAAFLLTYAVWFLTTYDGAQALQHMGVQALLPTRYLTWLSNVLQGNLGFSYRTGQPVLQSIFSRLPATLLLLVPAFILQEVIGVTLGLLSAVRYQTVIDRVITSTVFIFSSLPPISPTSTTARVAASSAKSGRMSVKVLPRTGSPPMPTAVVWPRPP